LRGTDNLAGGGRGGRQHENLKRERAEEKGERKHRSQNGQAKGPKPTQKNKRKSGAHPEGGLALHGNGWGSDKTPKRMYRTTNEE